MKDVCLVLGFRKGRHRALVAAARHSGLRVAVMQPGAVIGPDPYADLVIDGDEDHPGRALRAVADWAERTGGRLGGIVPLTEMTLASAAALAREWRLPGLGADVLAVVRDKRAMKRAFSAHGLATAPFEPFATIGELKAAGRTLGYPLVVKPSNAGGSEGVSLVRHEADAEAAFATLQRAVTGAGEKYDLDEEAFQAEAFVDAARELSVEILNTPTGRTACSITEKSLSPPPYFAETGQVTRAPGEADARLVNQALAACEAVGLDRGVAHVEMRIARDGTPVLLEVNARPPGQFICEIVELATGLNLFDLHVAAYLGEDEARAEPRDLGEAGNAYIKAPDGVIEAVVRPLPADLPGQVNALRIFAAPGDVVAPTIDSTTLGQGLVEMFAPRGTTLDPPGELAALLAPRIFNVRERQS